LVVVVVLDPRAAPGAVLPPLPLPEFYRRLHTIQPELSEITAMIDRTSDGLQTEVGSRLERVIESAFGTGERRDPSS
jgi:hypothetical protein